MWFWLWPWFRFGFARLRLRRASILDADRMAEIHAEGFAIGWTRDEFEQMILERSIADVLVSQAPFGEIVTGFAISRVVIGEAELLSIALDTEVRGLGLSSPLLEFHLGNLAKAGARTVFLEVADENHAALALYRAAGFREMGRRKGYYADAAGGSRHDALTMQADLGRFDPTPRFG
jgi:ribosomal-protein-alanine N-acetyltransferase